MRRYLWQRLLLTLISLAGVVLFSFILMHLIPGDPVDQMLGELASEQEKENLRHELGLDQPLGRQFLKYTIALASLDLGYSLHSRESVTQEILRHFPATLELSFAALILALAWGLPLGVYTAVHSLRWTQRLLNLVVLIGMSLPGVFIGPVLIYLFALKLDWFPVSERGGLEHIVLPSMSLALPLGAVIARMTGAAISEVLAQDFMRTAKAKGVGPWGLYFQHALRNALIPLITIIGLQLGALLTGTVITETIFDWQGLGTLIYSSIQRRDYPMVQGCILVVACTYVIVNLLTDLCYSIADPKVRLDK